MSNDYTLPPVPDHPFANSLSERWSEMEEVAIGRYGHAVAAPLLARIAELERSNSEFLDARRAWLASDAIKQSAIDRLRAELAREQKRRREIDDEAFEYAEQVESLRAEVEALRAGIEKAMSEIDDAGPKALKYARQELEAAIAARKGEGSEG